MATAVLPVQPSVKDLPLKVDLSTGYATFAGAQIFTTVKESLALDALISAYPKPVGRDGMCFALWGEHQGSGIGMPAARVHIANLNRRIRKARWPVHIRANPAGEYRFVWLDKR